MSRWGGKPPRTALLAGALLTLVAGGAAVLFWPRAEAPVLACAPEEVRLVDGVATCGASAADGALARGGQLRALGGKLDLSTATAEELAGLPGIGPKVAADLVAAREARPFGSWSDVDEVRGVGPATLELLKANAVLSR